MNIQYKSESGAPRGLLEGVYRKRAQGFIRMFHYAHSVPAGKSHYMCVGEGVFLIFSIPANYSISKFLIGEPNKVWELSRMWASDGHGPNALTQAVAEGVRLFKKIEPEVVALVSYADPNVGHDGGVYRSASWVYTGQSEEGRYYQAPDGQVVSRRKFHSGGRSMTKAEILATGHVEIKRPGKHRFAKGLTKGARSRILRLRCPLDDGDTSDLDLFAEVRRRQEI